MRSKKNRSANCTHTALQRTLVVNTGAVMGYSTLVDKAIGPTQLPAMSFALLPGRELGGTKINPHAFGPFGTIFHRLVMASVLDRLPAPDASSVNPSPDALLVHLFG